MNDIKHAFIERIGAECVTYDIPFFLEFVGYDPQGGDEKGLSTPSANRRLLPRACRSFRSRNISSMCSRWKCRSTQSSSRIERVQGPKAYSRAEALDHFRKAAAVAGKPFIYLSAGVSNAQFTESLHMASEAGTDFSGVLCGRATWKEGIPIYAKQGVKALEEWLAKEGVKNINAVNDAIKSAKPWFAKLEAPVPA